MNYFSSFFAWKVNLRIVLLFAYCTCTIAGIIPNLIKPLYWICYYVVYWLSHKQSSHDRKRPRIQFSGTSLLVSSTLKMQSAQEEMPRVHTAHAWGGLRWSCWVIPTSCERRREVPLPHTIILTRPTPVRSWTGNGPSHGPVIANVNRSANFPFSDFIDGDKATV